MIIGIPYTINFTDPSVPGKTPFVVNPNESDGPIRPIINTPDTNATSIHTSIVLPGMGLVQYGERVGESLVHILENFASCTAPVAPTIGQMWYNYCESKMYVYDGATTGWIAVGGHGVAVASLEEYNSLATTLNQIIGTPVGNTPAIAYGYNQQTLPIISGRDVTTAEWVKLIQTARSVGNHQATDVTSLVDTGFMLFSAEVSYGAITLLRRYEKLDQVVPSLVTNRFKVDPATQETDAPGAGTSTRGTTWTSQIKHEASVVFQTNAHARSFFNTGGSINLSAIHSNSSDADNTSLQTLLQSVGTVKLKAFNTTDGTNGTEIGFYDLTSSYQLVYTKNAGGAYANTKYDVYAAKTGNTITIRVVINAVGSMGASTSSSVTSTKASALYINNNEIPFPSVITTYVLTNNPV